MPLKENPLDSNRDLGLGQREIETAISVRKALLGRQIDSIEQAAQDIANLRFQEKFSKARARTIPGRIINMLERRSDRLFHFMHQRFEPRQSTETLTLQARREQTASRTQTIRGILENIEDTSSKMVLNGLPFLLGVGFVVSFLPKDIQEPIFFSSVGGYLSAAAVAFGSSFAKKRLETPNAPQSLSVAPFLKQTAVIIEKPIA